MIKKTLFLLAFILASFSLYAQNLQLHFDPRRAIHGKDEFPKNFFTATFEMFKPDKWGSTFLFVDLDFNQSRGNIGLGYMEIARDFTLGKCPLMAHIEFNGGVGNAEEYGFSVPNAYLIGPSYSTRIGEVNLSTYLVYKYNAFKKISHDVQWTATWSTDICNKKLTIAGFIDLWTENKNHTHETGPSGKKVILLTEPQFWYNVNSHLSFGTEVEISNNFLNNNQFYVNPTIAAKWNF
ncbi:DUF5020 family protein [Bacteroides sp. 224]|uniref:DUF5020 family protein n=1 Tax=Bacteroides sp. 224 TaxID=2302936 RepID=UPI0013D5C051|nr:DUF5020 family protein [Bacteroides sp. 224]NDV67203.1 DUF5020 family protein [Bacteroides sp. 224]